MTAGQQAMAFGNTRFNVNAVVHSGTPNILGFSSGIAGSIAPTNYKGLLILAAYANGGVQDFLIQIQSAPSQLFFDRVLVTDSTSVVRTYTAASAAYNATNKFWSWGPGTNKVWTVAGTYPMVILP